MDLVERLRSAKHQPPAAAELVRRHEPELRAEGALAGRVLREVADVVLEIGAPARRVSGTCGIATLFTSAR